MVDHHATVCCMCGDIGFPEKLFRCTGCKYRFQHSYCSNYYEELSSTTLEAGTGLCDWCQSKERSATTTTEGMIVNPNPKREATGLMGKRSEYSGEKIKRSDRDREESSSDRGGKNAGSAPSPRRRYKFLKDVLC